MLPFDIPMVHEGLVYKSVENFYQAQKCVDMQDKIIISSLSPFKSKQYAKTVKMVDNWKDLKLQVMETALRHKFQPGTSWYDKLMETKDEDIVEFNNWNDIFWGVDIKTNKGKNHLGKLLMGIRNEYLLKNMYE